MPWLEWFAFKHPVLVHLPMAVGLMLPLALMASMRPGRGIRPWWLVSRYLAWWGFLGSLLAAWAGFLLARKTGLLPGLGLASTATLQGALLRGHQILAVLSLGLGLLTLRMLHRRRQDHQGLGALTFLTALPWSVLLVVTGWQGARMTRPIQTVTVTRSLPSPPPTPSAPIPVARVTPEADLPAPILDFASLEPVHPQPVKTTVHGLRWIRAWVTPSSAEAYRKGEPLAPGTLVVLSTLEDRWGRPGLESGPLYALEILPDGKPSLSVYWGRVPAERRAEMGGAERVWWRRNDANLEGCMGCHAQGPAPMKDRSRLLPLPRIKTAEARPQG